MSIFYSNALRRQSEVTAVFTSVGGVNTLDKQRPHLLISSSPHTVKKKSLLCETSSPEEADGEERILSLTHTWIISHTQREK